MTDEHRLELVPTSLDADPGDIVREISIDAPADVVFSYFTDPSKHVLWQGIDAELDPRPGGTLRITFAPGYVVVGTYVEVEPPTRLLYTWGWAEEGSSVLPPGASTVEVTLEPVGTTTILRIRHTGLPDATFEFHGQGWDECLTELHRRISTAGKET